MAAGTRTFVMKFVGDTKSLDGDLGKINGKMMALGGAMTAGVTAPIVAMAASSVKAAADFETAFSGVRKNVQATDSEFAEIRKNILDLSKVMPASAEEIAGVVESAGALGISKGNLMEFTKVAIGMGVATNLSSEEAATGMAKLAAITQMPQTAFRNLGSTIVALGADGASTEADILAMGLRLAGVGNSVGLTEAQILGFAGGLSSMGLEAEGGGTAFSRVWAEMAKATAQGGADLENFAKIAGVSGKDFATLFKEDAAGATLKFVDGLRRISDEGGDVFSTLDKVSLGEIRVRDALLRSAGASGMLRDQVALGTKAWADNVAMQREVDEKNKTFAAQLDMLKNRWHAVQVEVGTALIPALLAALDALEPVFELIEKGATWFANLNGPMQTAVLIMAGIAAAVGPALLVLGSLMTIMGPLGLGAAAATLGPLIVAAFPFLAVGAAILAIIGSLYLLITNFDTVKAKAGEMWASIQNSGITGSGHAAGGTRSLSAQGADARAALGVTAGNVASWGSGMGEFGSGGVVPGPRGSRQLAMVHGGETILPTHKGGGWGGITVNVMGNTLQSDAELQSLLLGALHTAQQRGSLGFG
jgi:TP901 family phage tail tape measure protein